MSEHACEADHLGYARCTHPALLCGRHAAHVRHLPAWYVTELDTAA